MIGFFMSEWFSAAFLATLLKKAHFHNPCILATSDLGEWSFASEIF